MKKSIAILFITALTLAACQSASQTTEVSKTSVVSPTDTPQPTAVVATESQPQISPEVQAKFDQSEVYSINSNGQIEMQTADGKVIVQDIQILPDGTMTFTHEEQEYLADPTTIEINGQTLIFKDKDGRIWVIDSATLIDREALDIFAEHDFDRLYKSLNFKIENGIVKVYDKETEKLVFENGKFDLRFVVENLRPETLEKTDIEPINGDHRGAPREAEFYNADTYTKYRDAIENLIAPNEDDKISMTSLLLYEFADNNSYAWGFTLNLKKPGESMSTGHYLVFRNINGELVTYPIQDISPVDVGSFYDN